jgi:multiple antibiotic resistance protein
MLEIALVALTTFFATIGPVDVAAIFAGITHRNTPLERRRMAIRGWAIATGLMLVTAFFGEVVLRHMGITLAALRTAGGILLLLMAIDMVFARHSGGISATREETDEAATKADISVFPLATPLLAGPGAMGAAILLMAESNGDTLLQAAVIGALLVIMLLSLALLLLAGQVSRLLGVTGLNVISRVVGVLLAALAVQFLFDGIAASGLIPGL